MPNIKDFKKEMKDKEVISAVVDNTMCEYQRRIDDDEHHNNGLDEDDINYESQCLGHCLVDAVQDIVAEFLHGKFDGIDSFDEMNQDDFQKLLEDNPGLDRNIDDFMWRVFERCCKIQKVTNPADWNPQGLWTRLLDLDR